MSNPGVDKSRRPSRIGKDPDRLQVGASKRQPAEFTEGVGGFISGQADDLVFYAPQGEQSALGLAREILRCVSDFTIRAFLAINDDIALTLLGVMAVCQTEVVSSAVCFHGDTTTYTAAALRWCHGNPLEGCRDFEVTLKHEKRIQARMAGVFGPGRQLEAHRIGFSDDARQIAVVSEVTDEQAAVLAHVELSLHIAGANAGESG